MTTIAVKTNFEGDIRRFSVSSLTPFRLVEESIGRFYNLTTGNFRILFSNSEENLKPLTQENFNKIFGECGSPTKILRLYIQKVAPLILKEDKKSGADSPQGLSCDMMSDCANKTVQTESSKVIHETTQTSTQVEIPEISVLLDNPHFVAQLSQLMNQALSSRTLIDFIQDGFVPSLVNVMKELVNKNKAPVITSLPTQVTPLVLSETTIEQIEEENTEIAQEQIEEENKEMPQEQIEEENKEMVQEQNAEVVQGELTPVIKEESTPVIKEESTAATTPEKLSSLIPDTPTEIFGSPIKSFIYSLFKPTPKSNEKEVEEILDKLAAMGFPDREANLEVIKFHNKFNEGLDVIVEDLLLQGATNNYPVVSPVVSVNP